MWGSGWGVRMFGQGNSGSDGVGGGWGRGKEPDAALCGRPWLGCCRGPKLGTLSSGLRAVELMV